MQLSPQTAHELQQSCCLGCDDGFQHQLAHAIQNSNRRCILVNVEPDILLHIATHLGSLLGKGDACQRDLSPKVKVPYSRTKSRRSVSMLPAAIISPI